MTGIHDPDPLVRLSSTQWPQQAARPAADADGAAIAALITGVFFPPLGIIFGHVSRRQAKRRGLRPSGTATAGMILGYAFTVIMIITAIMVIMAFSASYPVTPGSCPPGSAWPYC